MSSPNSRSSTLGSVLLFCQLSLLSAFLLFQVQPVISKYILPWFGGSPGVWTTCMVFFQMVLFAGYAYAHALTKFLQPRTQFFVHGTLMLAALAFLPIMPGEGWEPAGNEDPAGRILLLLMGTVGLPYFILSSTSPLTQVWFTRAVPGGAPWRLYALSNLGSLAALLTYPFLIEPKMDVVGQAWAWSGVFVLFAGLSVWLAWRNQAAPPQEAAAPDPLPGPRPVAGLETEKSGTALEMDAAAVEKAPSAAVAEPVTRWWHRLLWVALPALASVMLLAATNHVCQDVAVVPFMWVVPLSLYLITFIICFEHDRWYVRGVWALLAMLFIFVTATDKTLDLQDVFSAGLEKGLGVKMDKVPPYLVDVTWAFGAMFLACMVCHGELARLKPAASRLTEFYLLMSAGGAVGGLLVSLVAPRVFVTYMEWPLALCASFMVASVALGIWLWGRRWPWLLGYVLVLVLAVWRFNLGTKGWMEWKETLLERWWKSGEELISKRFPDSLDLGQTLSLGSSLAAVVAVLGLVIYLQRRRWYAVVAGFALICVAIPGTLFMFVRTTYVDPRLERVRNFYGALNVDKDYDTGLESEYVTLTHGGIIHGIQNLASAYKGEPITYYGRHTGIGRALQSLKGRADARIGVVGMGAGTVACYAQAGQHWRFYEINPAIQRLARTYFTYLNDAEARGADVQTIIGDARLMLKREPDQKFDVMLLDAFSGDAIPMHLLTKEAFAIYHRHMKPDGIIAVHVTNTYLALAPVVERQARELGLRTTRVITEEDDDTDDDSTDYILISQNHAFMDGNPPDEPEEEEPKDIPLWTDRYHNLFQILLD